jgi:hypothetical protein
MSKEERMLSTSDLLDQLIAETPTSAFLLLPTGHLQKLGASLLRASRQASFLVVVSSWRLGFKSWKQERNKLSAL